MGATEDERSYRRWCLRERLFLNPLNEAYTDSVAATDVLHLPSHTYGIEDAPRFPAYYNLMKQEYISARYRHHYEAETLRSDHLYQLDAYLDNLQPEDARCEAMLLYPTTDRRMAHSYMHKGHKISIRTIDLARPWQRIHRDLLELVI